MLKIKHFLVLVWFLLFPVAGFSQFYNTDFSIKAERMKFAAYVKDYLSNEENWYEGKPPKPPTRDEMEVEQSRADYINKLAGIDKSRWEKEFFLQRDDPLAQNILRFHSYSRLRDASECLAANYLSLGPEEEVVCYRSILEALQRHSTNLLTVQDRLAEMNENHLRSPLVNAIVGASGFWRAYQKLRMKGGCTPYERKEFLGGCPRRGK